MDILSLVDNTIFYYQFITSVQVHEIIIECVMVKRGFHELIKCSSIEVQKFCWTVAIRIDYSVFLSTQ